jgi:hypothetical protein
MDKDSGQNTECMCEMKLEIVFVVIEITLLLQNKLSQNLLQPGQNV